MFKNRIVLIVMDAIMTVSLSNIMNETHILVVPKLIMCGAIDLFPHAFLWCDVWV
jgi:hypothetical protein